MKNILVISASVLSIVNSNGAQKCKSNQDCEDAFPGGCCFDQQIKNPNGGTRWGKFSYVWGGDESMEPGSYFTSCIPQNFSSKLESIPNINNTANVYRNIDLLELYFDMTHAPIDAFSLREGDEFKDWVRRWGSDIPTLTNLEIEARCLETEDSATKISLASTISVLILIFSYL